MKRLLYALAGIGFTALGFVGLLIPILPGFLFFIVAAFCFARAFRVVGRQLDRHPVLGPAQHRWTSGQKLPLLDRMRLGFWLAADTTIKLVKGSRPGR